MANPELLQDFNRAAGAGDRFLADSEKAWAFTVTAEPSSPRPKTLTSAPWRQDREQAGFPG